MRMCMSVPREGGWINDDFVHAYVRMYELGFAHSVEVFHNNELVGGLYGLGFAGFLQASPWFTLRVMLPRSRSCISQLSCANKVQRCSMPNG